MPRERKIPPYRVVFFFGASNRTPLYNCERLYLFFNVSCDTSIRNIVAYSLGALRIAPCFFLLVTFLHPPPAAEADEPVNSRRGVNAVSTGERTVQRYQRKEKYHPTGWIAVRQTVAYRCVAVGRTCDTLSVDRLLPQPNLYRNGKTIHRIVFPATDNSRAAVIWCSQVRGVCRGAKGKKNTTQ